MLEMEREDKRTHMGDSTGERWVMTPTAAEIHAALRRAGLPRDDAASVEMAAIVGGPGTGKTTAVRRYERDAHHVLYVEIRPMSGSPRGMVRVLCEAIEQIACWTARRSADVVRILRREMGDRLLGVQRRPVLILDEAQLLSTDAIAEAVAITQEANAGLVLVGNLDTLRRSKMRVSGRGLNHPTLRADFDRLVSRLSLRVEVQVPTLADVLAVAAQWGVDADDDDTVAPLIEIATTGRQRLGLRAVRDALNNAEGIARERGIDRITADLVVAGWEATGKSDRGVFE